jgi:hypothetical protein
VEEEVWIREQQSADLSRTSRVNNAGGEPPGTGEGRGAASGSESKDGDASCFQLASRQATGRFR